MLKVEIRSAIGTEKTPSYPVVVTVVLSDSFCRGGDVLASWICAAGIGGRILGRLDFVWFGGVSGVVPLNDRTYVTKNSINSRRQH